MRMSRQPLKEEAPMRMSRQPLKEEAPMRMSSPLLVRPRKVKNKVENKVEKSATRERNAPPPMTPPPRNSKNLKKKGMEGQYWARGAIRGALEEELDSTRERGEGPWSPLGAVGREGLERHALEHGGDEHDYVEEVEAASSVTSALVSEDGIQTEVLILRPYMDTDDDEIAAMEDSHYGDGNPGDEVDEGGGDVMRSQEEASIAVVDYLFNSFPERGGGRGQDLNLEESLELETRLRFISELEA